MAAFYNEIDPFAARQCNRCPSGGGIHRRLFRGISNETQALFAVEPRFVGDAQDCGAPMIFGRLRALLCRLWSYPRGLDYPPISSRKGGVNKLTPKHTPRPPPPGPFRKPTK